MLPGAKDLKIIPEGKKTVYIDRDIDKPLTQGRRRFKVITGGKGMVTKMNILKLTKQGEA